MTNVGQLHMLYTCPFCWKVRGLLEHLDIPHERVQVNPMKQKKTLPSAPEWTKVPVWVDSNSGVHVDSTPIMKQIDAVHNDGKLWASDDEARRDEWMEWVDLHMSKATIPILHGLHHSTLQPFAEFVFSLLQERRNFSHRFPANLTTMTWCLS